MSAASLPAEADLLRGVFQAIYDASDEPFFTEPGNDEPVTLLEAVFDAALAAHIAKASDDEEILDPDRFSDEEIASAFVCTEDGLRCVADMVGFDASKECLNLEEVVMVLGVLVSSRLMKVDLSVALVEDAFVGAYRTKCPTDQK